MKEIMKRYAILGVSMIIGLTIYDMIAGKEITVSGVLTRIIVTVVLYFVFGLVEYKSNKNKNEKTER